MLISIIENERSLKILMRNILYISVATLKLTWLTPLYSKTNFVQQIPRYRVKRSNPVPHLTWISAGYADCRVVLDPLDRQARRQPGYVHLFAHRGLIFLRLSFSLLLLLPMMMVVMMMVMIPRRWRDVAVYHDRWPANCRFHQRPGFRGDPVAGEGAVVVTPGWRRDRTVQARRRLARLWRTTQRLQIRVTFPLLKSERRSWTRDAGLAWIQGRV